MLGPNHISSLALGDLGYSDLPRPNEDSGEPGQDDEVGAAPVQEGNEATAPLQGGKEPDWMETEDLCAEERELGRSSTCHKD